MKLLFFNSSLGSGGAERVLSTLSNSFAQKGYDVTIATYNNSKEDFYEIEKNIKRIKFGTKLGNNIIIKTLKRFQKLYQIRKIIKEEKPDIILPLIIYTNIEVLIASIGLNTKILVAEHSNYFAVKSKFERIVRLLSYKLATKVVLLTQKDKLIYDKYLENNIVINNPILLEKSDDKELTRSKTILCVGRMAKVKQFNHAIKAMSILHKKYPDWKLQIAGLGPELENFKNYAKELKVDKNVKFLGNIKNIDTYYRSCSIFVLCSQYEGLPMVIGEAMLSGLPVVAYDCPTGPSEFIDDNINGLIVRHNDIDDLILKIETIINNSKKAEELAINARKKIKEFSKEKIVKKWEDLFEEVLN